MVISKLFDKWQNTRDNAKNIITENHYDDNYGIDNHEAKTVNMLKCFKNQ